MLDFALGELGLLPDQFWAPDYTWNDLDRATRGYHLRQSREWERTRQVGEWLLPALGVDLRKELGGRRLLELPTDPSPTTSTSVETEAEFMARMARNNFFLPPHGNA